MGSRTLYPGAGVVSPARAGRWFRAANPARNNNTDAATILERIPAPLFEPVPLLPSLSGLVLFRSLTYRLRGGLYSCAASRLNSRRAVTASPDYLRQARLKLTAALRTTSETATPTPVLDRRVWISGGDWFELPA